MPELADVFRQFGASYLDQHGHSVLPSHRRAVRDLVNCRTVAMGGHLEQCDTCGHQQLRNHSCKNRSCPKCQHAETQRWIQQRKAELLPTRHFHVVFTLPQELRELVRRNQKRLLDALFKAAAESLLKLAEDERFVGGQVGILAVLHTWTRTMVWHPHVHCLVTGGGLAPSGDAWLPSRRAFLVPVKALSQIFRAKFVALIRRRLPEADLPEEIWRNDWVVFTKSTLEGADALLRYLGRYVRRAAITNSRILAVRDDEVAFTYRCSKDRRVKVMRLSPLEFCRRFLQHVLPRGFHKIRYYGLFSPRHRQALRRIREQLLLTAAPSSKIEPIDDVDEPTGYHHRACSECDQGLMVVVGRFQPKWYYPP
jgi:hypothetical protein